MPSGEGEAAGGWKRGVVLSCFVLFCFCIEAGRLGKKCGRLGLARNKYAFGRGKGQMGKGDNQMGFQGGLSVISRDATC